MTRAEPHPHVALSHGLMPPLLLLLLPALLHLLLRRALGRQALPLAYDVGAGESGWRCEGAVAAVAPCGRVPAELDAVAMAAEGQGGGGGGDSSCLRVS